MQPVSTRRTVSPVFGQLYVSAAVLAFAALFVPLYVRGDVEYPPLSEIQPSSSVDSYSLWRGIVSYGESIAVVATLLVLALVVLAVIAAHRLHSFLIAGALLVLGVIGLVVLIADPDRPSRAVSGAGLGMLWGAVLVVVATSAVHLFRATSAPRP